ncbi:diaminopimelate epimerase [Longirhabdus pacifica]|uniref:diaminopimelate epimerase n=1 Tax=Longirhabdus pacifica TaxID=2305227 RepID=UPI001008BAF2|nr:diaminopimelate epimerase [Longirhabdus pacifica]
MKFTKMHGLGNDFVIVNDEQVPHNIHELAEQICDRHFGVGADGLVYILPSQQADVKMRIFNADGTEAEQCGNAIRCVAKYVYDHQLTNKRQLEIETAVSVQRVVLTVEDNKVSTVQVDMGAPILQGTQIPTVIQSDVVKQHPIEIEGTTFHFTAVSMGNPHCVIFVDDAVNTDLHAWGPKIEKHSYFPNKINVEFVTAVSPQHLDMRVWERGVGPTLACGTGACATLVAAVLNGKADRSATVSLAGGDLYIKWNEADDHVYMTGAATEVYTGVWA